jgi:hypothetical protein
MKLFDVSPGAEAGSADLRRAALLLHSMPVGDRQWLLSQLSARDQERLMPLLAELDALGIPADRSLVSDALAAGPQADTLAHAAIVQALLREPDQLVVALLRCGPWEWQTALFAAFTPARRRSVEAALRAAASTDEPASALRDALIHGLRTRVAQIGPADAGTPAPWQRAWRRLAGRFDPRPHMRAR